MRELCHCGQQASRERAVIISHNHEVWKGRDKKPVEPKQAKNSVPKSAEKGIMQSPSGTKQGEYAALIDFCLVGFVF